MFPRICAFVITRNAKAAERALDSIRTQTLTPDDVCILDCSGKGRSALPGIVKVTDTVPPVRHFATPGAANLGEALKIAATIVDSQLLNARWWWLLHDDCEAEPTCLEKLCEASERGRTIGAAGPKQLDISGTHILEVGIEATSSARRLEAILPGEIDQGQYDSRADVLGVGTAGMLLDPKAWEKVGGFDTALGPFGDGLDISRRLHRAGYRVITVPSARIRHERASLATPALRAGAEDAPTGVPEDSAAGITEDESADLAEVPRLDADSSFAPRRFAQLYNWAKAVPALLLPFLMLWLLVWTPMRAFLRLLSGRAHLAIPELSAWLRLQLVTPHLLLERAKARRSATTPRSALRPLEASSKRLRTLKKESRRLGDVDEVDTTDPIAVRAFNAYKARNFWVFVATLAGALTLSAARWWGMGSGFAGGAWVHPPTNLSQLWQAASSGWIPSGDGYAAAPDPSWLLLTVLLAPFALAHISASTVLAWFLFACTPAAAITAWIFAARLTRSYGLKAAAALAWATLPALSMSLTQGRLIPALFHVIVPLAASAWLRMLAPPPALLITSAFGPVPHVPRHYFGALARFVLLSALFVALTPAAFVLLILALIPLISRGVGVRALYALIPSALLITPTVVDALRIPGAWRGLLTTSGSDAPFPVAHTWEVLLAMPAHEGDLLRFVLAALPMGILFAVALVVLPAKLWAKTAPTRRAMWAPAFFAASACAIAVANIVRIVDVGVAQSHVTTAWISPLLSVAALALIASILCAMPSPLETGSRAMKHAGRLGALIVVCALLAGASPVLARLGVTLTLSDAEQSASQNTSTHAPQIYSDESLVAAVSAQGQALPRLGRVLILDADEALSTIEVDLWRSAGPGITDSTPLMRASRLTGASAQDAASTALEELVVSLLVYPDASTARALATHAIDTILVPADCAGVAALSAGLDRATGLERVGETDAGILWRVRPEGQKPARARIDTSGSWQPIDSTASGVNTRLDEGVSGTLVLAERADPHWHAYLNGTELRSTTVDGWAQGFEGAAAGELTVRYENFWMRSWAVSVLVVLGVALVGALPWRRKQ